MATRDASPRPGSASPRDAAIGIVRTLRDAGHVAYLAGGCVRDELVGLHPQDYDVATDATPERVAAVFPRTREVGKSFGVMLVSAHRSTIEVATFRAEGPYTDKRRPDAVRFASPEEDARRRDFTINALFIDPLDTSEGPMGRIIDFVGGRDDLRARVIRAVGDPEARLAEDHLRALRAVRFGARLSFAIDPATRAAIAQHAVELAGVSRERIGDEVRRMLAHPTRGVAARLLHELGLDAPTLTEPPDAGASVATLAGIAPDADVPTALVAWALDRGAVAPPMGEPVAARVASEVGSRWRSALCLTNEEREAFTNIARSVGAIESAWDTLGVARRKRLAAGSSFEQAMAIVRVRMPQVGAGVDAATRELAASPGGIAPDPIVTGDDLTGAGLRPGPRFGVWLDRLYDLQLEGALSDANAGIALVRAWMAEEADGRTRG